MLNSLHKNLKILSKLNVWMRQENKNLTCLFFSHYRMYNLYGHYKTFFKVLLISSLIASTKETIIFVAIFITFFMPLNLSNICTFIVAIVSSLFDYIYCVHIIIMFFLYHILVNMHISLTNPLVLKKIINIDI
jgi:hypothetical protein